MISQALQDLALLKGFWPDACSEKLAIAVPHLQGEALLSNGVPNPAAKVPPASVLNGQLMS